jgi:hypothetical protein
MRDNQLGRLECMGNVVGSMAASLPGGEIQGGSFSDAIGKLANRAAKSNGKLDNGPRSKVQGPKSDL